MLRVKSFDIKDDKGINELLDKYRLARSTGILVSNGSLAIAYEDGEPQTTAQRLVELKEEKQDILTKMDIILQSQEVLELTKEGVQKQLEELEKDVVAPDSKTKYDKEKEIKAEKKRLENVLSQTEDQMNSNNSELTRYQLNVQMFDNRIKKLEDGK